MVGRGGSSAGSYLADPTSLIPSHCSVTVLFKKCPSASIVVTSAFGVKVVYLKGLNTPQPITFCQLAHTYHVV